MIKTTARITICLILTVAVHLPWANRAAAQERSRFFYSGDGRLHLISAKNGRSFDSTYRRGADEYLPAALERIQVVFDAPVDEPLAKISLRLIEFLDYLQDRLKPDAAIRISSGWRSPAYNTKLRQAGRLAATASLHQYGMAADIEIQGVPSRSVWAFVKELGFGGAGYYHGKTVHVDVGPARFWDETSSGVGTGISDDNKLIGLVSDYDIYRPGDTVVMRFVRMTAFPIGVSPQMALMRLSDTGLPSHVLDFTPAYAKSAGNACPQFHDIGQIMNIRWHLPRSLSPGRYRIEASFCQKDWPDMPNQVATPDFELRPGAPK